ncbi:uncharacterized protein [Dendrobates tinctorius]|uniref:uncharacterized protein n=1 Tax=Dendrobates tinctorius TaxID=92724 RepID=UPI003CC9D6D3
MECGLSSPHSTGSLVNSRVTSPQQHFGDTSDQISSTEFPPSLRRSPHQDPIRQRHDCSVYQPPGKYSELDGHARSESHPPLGRDQPFAHLSNPHPGSKELGNRFSQTPRPCLGRVVSSSGSLSADLSSLGDSRCGSHGLKTKQQGSSIHCPIVRSMHHRSGCPSSAVAPVPAPVHLSPSSLASEGHQEDPNGGSTSNPSRARLAAPSIVRRTNTTSRRCSLATSRSHGSTLTGLDLPPGLRGPVFDGVAVESWILAQAGFSHDVISTMISARKPVSMRIYHRIWKTFSWCKDHGRSPLVFSIPAILEFLQSVLKSGLALSSLKGQISTLSVLLQCQIATKLQVKTFIQGVSLVGPPYRRPLESWDVNLVLTGGSFRTAAGRATDRSLGNWSF